MLTYRHNGEKRRKNYEHYQNTEKTGREERDNHHE